MKTTDDILRALGKTRAQALDEPAIPAHRMAQVLKAFHRPTAMQALLAKVDNAFSSLFTVGFVGAAAAHRGGEQTQADGHPTFFPSSDISLTISPNRGRSRWSPLPLLLLRAPGSSSFEPLSPAPDVSPGPAPGWAQVRLDPAVHLHAYGDYGLAVVLMKPSTPEDDAEAIAQTDLAASAQGGAPVSLFEFTYAPSI